MNELDKNIVRIKYPVDTKLFFIVKRFVKEQIECPMCRGEGKLFNIKQEKIVCSLCNGVKTINSDKGVWVKEIQEDIVTEVNILQRNYNNYGVKNYIHYNFGSKFRFEEDELFATYEDAQLFLKNLIK